MAIKVQETKEATCNNDWQVKLPISRTDGKRGKSGQCIVAEKICWNDLPLNNSVFQEWTLSQVNALRSRIASEINATGVDITNEDIAIESLLVAMESESQSFRLTTKALEVFIESELKAPITSALAAKGYSSGNITKVLTEVSATLAEICQRNVTYCPKREERISKILAYLPDTCESPVPEAIVSRLEKIRVKTPETSISLEDCL